LDISFVHIVVISGPCLVEIMEKAHKGGFLYVCLGFLKGKKVSDNGCPERVFRNRFSPGSKKLVPRSGRLLQHAHFKEKVNKRSHVG
jgi:hypothetical protein